jgi:hypothetical protein
VWRRAHRCLSRVLSRLTTGGAAFDDNTGGEMDPVIPVALLGTPCTLSIAMSVCAGVVAHAAPTGQSQQRRQGAET